MSNPAPGSIWVHYKGGHYRVIAVARLEADPLKEVVVYQALYGNFSVWARPLDVWFENVRVKGGSRPRFEQLEATLL